jgi:hypothetical protein
MRRLAEDVNAILTLLARTGHRDEHHAQQAYEAAWNSMFAGGKSTLQRLAPAHDLTRISESLARLSLAAPDVKKRALSAAAIAITFDQKVTTEEAELFRAIAESLNCPVPPVVASAIQRLRAAEQDA